MGRIRTWLLLQKVRTKPNSNTAITRTALNAILREHSTHMTSSYHALACQQILYSVQETFITVPSEDRAIKDSASYELQHTHRTKDVADCRTHRTAYAMHAVAWPENLTEERKLACDCCIPQEHTHFTSQTDPILEIRQHLAVLPSPFFPHSREILGGHFLNTG